MPCNLSNFLDKTVCRLPSLRCSIFRERLGASRVRSLRSPLSRPTEGTALHHCVASYADRCWRGASRIWALRVRRGEKVRHVLTVEVDIKRRAVVQARGWGNRVASGKPLRLLQDWTARERLRLAI